MRTDRVPCRPVLSEVPYFNVSRFPRGPSGRASAKAMVRGGRRGGVRALLLDMTVTKMDDGGMYAWAAVVTVVSLALSYVIAFAWRRRQESRKKA